MLIVHSITYRTIQTAAHKMAAFTVVVSGLSYAEFDYTFNKENRYLSKKCLVVIFGPIFYPWGLQCCAFGLL